MLTLSLAAAGCESPGEPTSFRLLEPFNVQVGHTAVVELSLKITFDGVTTDSRCPADVVCIQAGDATAKILVAAVDQPAEALDLHTAPKSPDAVYQSYAIRLQALTPLPRSDRPI